MANKAIAGLLNEIDETGEVQHVSVGTGMGDNLDFYRTIGMTAMPYGQSLTILCLTELLVSIARKVRRKVHEKRKVLFTAVMVLAGLQLLSGCGKTEASANDTVVLRYAYASNSQPVIDSMKKFGELVEEKQMVKFKLNTFQMVS